MLMKSTILLMALVSVTLGGKSPVLLWGGGLNSENSPALKTVSQDEFTEIFTPVLKEAMVVVFLELKLSSEDLSRCSGKESCSRNLRAFQQVSYLPNVENPIEAVRQISENREFVTVNEKGELGHDVAYESGKVVFVSFDASTKALERNDLLELHDEYISQIFNNFAASGKTVGVYTRTQALNRKRRQSAEPTHVFRHGKQFLFYYSSAKLTNTNTKTSTPLDFTIMTVSNVTEKIFRVELIGGENKVTFNITSNMGYYSLSALQVNDADYSVYPAIEAPTTFSYFCGNATFTSLDKVSVIAINSLQFQAPFDARFNDQFVFGDAWHCVGFVSAGILSGLFVVILFLIILAIGICWLLDINTMDRFDDPKGKTITINTTE